MDDDSSTEALQRELRETQTDLARLVEHVLVRKLSVVTLTSQMVAAWEQRAPEAWAKVKQWLRARNVKIVIVPSHPKP